MWVLTIYIPDNLKKDGLILVLVAYSVSTMLLYNTAEKYLIITLAIASWLMRKCCILAIQSCSLALHPHHPKLQLITFCYHKISTNAEISDCFLVQVHVVWMSTGWWILEGLWGGGCSAFRWPMLCEVWTYRAGHSGGSLKVCSTEVNSSDC